MTIHYKSNLGRTFCSLHLFAYAQDCLESPILNSHKTERCWGRPVHFTRKTTLLLHTKLSAAHELLVRQAVKGQPLLPGCNQPWSFCSWAMFKRPEDTKKLQSGASKHCKVTKRQATYRPWTTCCSHWMRLSLLSITDCWTYVTLSDSCLAKCSALVPDGRSRRYGWILERPRSEDEKKLQSGSTSSSASDRAIGATFNLSASRTWKTLRHCGHFWSCFSSGKSTCVGHVWTCDLLPSKATPYKFVLL